LINRKILITLFSIIIIIGLFTTCSTTNGQKPAYDINKEYAAFLVVNYPQAADILNTAKDKSIGEGYEIGPIVYYEPGTTDFTYKIKQLIPSKQISLIWVISSLFDVPNIQKALTGVEYKGYIRYMPVSGQASH
jgi:hypothetical protein